MTKKRDPKIKTPKVSKLKKEAWRLFSRYVRYRDGLKTTGCLAFCLCVTCQRRYHFKLIQAGHFVAGRHNGGLFSEKGVNGQCYNCNINLKGNTLVYRRKLIEMYGVGIDDELEIEAAQIKQFEPQELIDKIAELKEKIKTMGGELK